MSQLDNTEENSHVRYCSLEKMVGVDVEAQLWGHKSVVGDLLTILALSCHAIFEGLAVGLEDTAAEVITLFAAISIHKNVIAFCVGLELFTKQANSTKASLFYMVTFALMSPIGIGIGMAFSNLIDDTNTAYFAVQGILQGIAGGTLLYVVVFEILQREKVKEKVPGLAQLLFVVLGFAGMLFVQIFCKFIFQIDKRLS